VQQTPQAEAGVTYAKKILKDEARIDWTKSAGEIDCHIRGLSPWPGAWTEVNGERLKVLYGEPIAGSGRAGVALDDALTIACGEDTVRLVKVQRAGGKAMGAADLLKGFPVPRGTHFA
jgi:methionyl-tRNA formyltransferase